MFKQTIKKDLSDRLNRILGQIEGIKRMVEEDRPCIEVLTQISSIHEALRGVGKLIMRNYLETCATKAIRSGSQKKAEEVYSELMDVIYKFVK